ncbi:MAG TPA: hypothetical protein VJZ49_03360 [Syntrophales bacterium]|nr:hypothetical protein [Syntrophales bacterium]
MAEKVSEYIVIDYVDELEEAISNAKRHEMVDIAKGLGGIHGDLVELGNLADSEEKLKRLKADIEKPLEDIVANCKAGNGDKSLDSLRTLRDKFHTLKVLWSRG